MLFRLRDVFGSFGEALYAPGPHEISLGMVGHLKTLARNYDTLMKAQQHKAAFAAYAALRDEFSKLRAMDFAPNARADFLLYRLVCPSPKGLQGTFAEMDALCREGIELILPLLDLYGPMVGPPRRQFPWLNDSELRTIVERDYTELATILLPGGAWKSTIVMAGSITEAILHDLIVTDAVKLAKAKANPTWPTYRGGQKKGNPKSEDDLTLEDLIRLGTVVGLIETEDEETFDRVLRNYRNFVHPTREIKDERECTEGRALMAKGALDALCETLARRPPL